MTLDFPLNRFSTASGIGNSARSRIWDSSLTDLFLMISLFLATISWSWIVEDTISSDLREEGTARKPDMSGRLLALPLTFLDICFSSVDFRVLFLGFRRVWILVGTGRSPIPEILPSSAGVLLSTRCCLDLRMSSSNSTLDLTNNFVSRHDSGMKSEGRTAPVVKFLLKQWWFYIRIS